MSITHAGELVAVAVGDGPVGIDLEPVIRLDDLAALVRAYAPETAPALRGVDDPIARAAIFLRAWTRKEALIKADGRGLGEIDPCALDARGPVAHIGTVRFRLRDLALVDGYVGAVAFPAEE